MEFEGKTYEQIYATYEELVIIDSLSYGADIGINIHNSSYEQAMSHADSIDLKQFPYRGFRDLVNDVIYGFIVFEIKNKQTTITHYIRMGESLNGIVL